MSEKNVYLFGGGVADGNAGMKVLLGGKGANLAEMARIGLPVPPGLTITTEVCTYYTAHKSYPGGLEKLVAEGLAHIEKATGKVFGDAANPLLVSVRSGARASMPGMMDTILNLGLNDTTVEGLIKQTSNPRFAYDCYRRFVSMYGDVVLGCKPQGKDEEDPFEVVLDEVKAAKGVRFDTELGAEDLKDLVRRFKEVVKERTGHDFPEDPQAQLWGAIGAVFGSWDNPRAHAYRKMNGIPEDWGTAVNVQAMVFGNMGDDSGTGVAFTRDPATGENVFYGEFLVNAQGEDVVAGMRTPRPVKELGEVFPEVYTQLLEVRATLEKQLHDMQDFEFTVERGTLYMLQTRTGKRTGLAAIRIAVDMVERGADPARGGSAPRRAGAAQPAAAADLRPGGQARGVGRGPGSRQGPPRGPRRRHRQGGVQRPRRRGMGGEGRDGAAGPHRDEPRGHPRHERCGGHPHRSRRHDVPRGPGRPADGQDLRGGLRGAAHRLPQAAARGGRPRGARGRLDVHRRLHRRGDPGPDRHPPLRRAPGPASSGRWPRTPPRRTSTTRGSWSGRTRCAALKVRTNADQPDQAANAVAFGAEGIGLCRTEHMFFGGERITAVREMILADNTEERQRALAKLLPMQRDDFAGIFRAMGERPVTIRTLDPPLHEFLPHTEKEQAEVARDLGVEPAVVAAKVADLHEANPMLGHRGCRLGIAFPEITRMQARAILEAACIVKKEGVDVQPEIMIPLVGTRKELADQAGHVRAVAEEVFREHGVTVDYLVGTMIELPRAALTADDIAEEAEFFSFGTNDLTQTTFGVSRDDAGKFLPLYLEREIWPVDPFASLDVDGVGQLVEIGTRKGRSTRPDLKVGICGEHGGDPASVAFCHTVGMNYVSCSPFRIPVARLAAARAQLAEPRR